MGLPRLNPSFTCVLKFSNIDPTELISQLEPQLQNRGMTIKKERSLKSDAITILHITGCRSHGYKHNYRFVKHQFNRLLLASHNGYQIPGTDIILNHGQSILAALQKRGIVNLTMQPDKSNRLYWWQKAMHPTKVRGLKQYLTDSIIHFWTLISICLFVEAFGTNGSLLENSTNVYAFHVEMYAIFISCWYFFIIITSTSFWPFTIFRPCSSAYAFIIAHNLVAYIITVMQYLIEQWIGYDSIAYCVPSLVYTVCRIGFMFIANNKKKRMITRINAIKIHLRLPLLACFLYEDEMFHPAAVRQIFWWRIAGSVCDTIVLFLKLYAKQLYRRWRRSNHQKDNSDGFMDDNDPLVKQNRRTTIMQDYSVEGFYIDFFYSCTFTPVMALGYPDLLAWAMLRFMLEVILNYIKIFYAYKQTIQL